mmetsp:Transcript_37514/g.87484  ORF Transcript_37514/g.87484 Transcript_37514/m.87484 type:complete len:233 (-) Transcript_37514:249-947(-)
MLAPRKKLWSTPDTVIDTVFRLSSITFGDSFWDIGCGDGRVLIRIASQLCQQTKEAAGVSDDQGIEHESHEGGISLINADERPVVSSPPSYPCRQLSIPVTTFIGIEIDPERAAEASENVRRSYHDGDLDRDIVDVQIHCRNALDMENEDLQPPTIIFLYLIPRGLRKIKPWILRLAKAQQIIDKKKDTKLLPLRVITYMAAFEGDYLVRKERCVSKKIDLGVIWPLFLHHF